MKKTYMTPCTDVMQVELQQLMETSGGGVGNGGKTGDEFSDGDVSYSRGSHSLWDDDNEE